MDDLSYQSKLTEKQLPLMKLELLLDEISNTLSYVKKDILEGRVSRNYPTLKEQYLNILVRTSNLGFKGDFELLPSDKQKETVAKAESYIKFLQDKNIYSLGVEDLRI